MTDPLAFGRLVQERQQIEAQAKGLDQLEQVKAKLIVDCEAKWQRVLDLRKAITNTRAEFISSTLYANDFVKIAVIPFGFDARVIERDLRGLLDVLDERFESDILHLESGFPVSGLAFELAQSDDREGKTGANKEKHSGR